MDYLILVLFYLPDFINDGFITKGMLKQNPNITSKEMEIGLQ
jgi:hypothetical protein